MNNFSQILCKKQWRQEAWLQLKANLRSIKKMKFADFIHSFDVKASHYIYNRVMNHKLMDISENGKYMVFRNVDAIEVWQKEAENIVPSLGFSKEGADALRCYCGYMHKGINGLLRKSESNDCWIKYIKCISSEMVDRELHGEILVSRWVHLKIIQECFGEKLKKIRAGNTYTDLGYMSTSLLSNYMGCYDCWPRDISKYILMLIKVSRRTTGIHIPKAISDRNEYELILNKGQNVLIEKIFYKFSSPFILVCKIN